MAVVGLTGGIASGKSKVSRMFEALGVPVLDADYVSRLVVLPGTLGLARVVEAFGEEYLLDDDTLNRKALGDLVFKDQAARRVLESILKPFIAAETGSRLFSLELTSPYVIYENALLVEQGLYSICGSLIVVTTDKGTQKSRLMARNSLTEEEADDRISSQAPLVDKVSVADFIISNGRFSTDEALKARVFEVHNLLLKRFK